MPYFNKDIETQCSSCKTIYDKEKAQCPACGMNGSDSVDNLLRMARVPDKATIEMALGDKKAS
jgi:rRNA maturation endonuclease Nob1